MSLACLEDEIKADRRNASARSLLALVLTRGYVDAVPDNRGEADLERALILAREAFDLAPLRSRSHLALFYTRFYAKRYDEAFDAARRTLAINPNSSLMAAAIGAAYIARGEFDNGLPLLTRIEADAGSSNPYFVFNALAAQCAATITTPRG